MQGDGRQEAETVDGFSRTQIKMEDGTYLAVNSADDIETVADYMKAQKYQLEDNMGVVMGLLEEGQTFDGENRVPDSVKYSLYFTFNDGVEGIPYAGYLPTVDGQLVFGSAKVVLGVSKAMEYTGIAGTHYRCRPNSGSCNALWIYHRIWETGQCCKEAQEGVIS